MVKTITIDMEAYTMLARRKRGSLSFSEVIKAHFGRTPTAAGFREILEGVRLSPETVAGVERQIRTRRASPARSAAL